MQIDYLSKNVTLTKNINRGKRIRSSVVCGALTGNLKRKTKKINKITKKMKFEWENCLCGPFGND